MDVRECALGFMNAQALLTAEEMGGVDALDGGPCAAADLGEEVGLPEDSATRPLTMLCALGAVARRPAGARRMSADERRTGPPVVARQDLNMLVAARGRERTADEYADWIGRFGFALERVRPTPSQTAFLIARRI